MALTTKYDIAIIGAGPGGYVAALRAGQQGRKVVLIEKEELGGVCLNWGCIPVKTLEAGVRSGLRQWPALIERKNSVVENLKKGVAALLKARGVEIVHGMAILAGEHEISAADKKLYAGNIILATGSKPAELACLPFNGTTVISSNGIFSLKEPSPKLLIAGGGAIGCEIADIFNALGSAITVTEALGSLLPGFDKEICMRLESVFKKKGIAVRTKSPCDGKLEPGQIALVAIGRGPNTEGLNLEKIGIKTDAKGWISVNERLQTSIPHIYAIGDCIGGYLLAHVASHEALVAVDNILGKKRAMDYSSVPSSVYTDPEIACVGLTEDEARQKGLEARSAKFFFRASGRAQTLNKTEGMVKLVGCDKTGRFLGAQIIGESASELIAELALAIRLKATIKDLEETIHGHPTLNEAIAEAAHIFTGRPLHSL